MCRLCLAWCQDALIVFYEWGPRLASKDQILKLVKMGANTASPCFANIVIVKKKKSNSTNICSERVAFDDFPCFKTHNVTLQNETSQE